MRAAVSERDKTATRDRKRVREECGGGVKVATLWPDRGAKFYSRMHECMDECTYGFCVTQVLLSHCKLLKLWMPLND